MSYQTQPDHEEKQLLLPGAPEKHDHSLKAHHGRSFLFRIILTSLLFLLSGFCPRWLPLRIVVSLLAMFGIFTVYLLRVNITMAILVMSDQYHWSDTEQGIILAAFFIGYILTQVIFFSSFIVICFPP
jgi:hypothetical protein